MFVFETIKKKYDGSWMRMGKWKKKIVFTMLLKTNTAGLSLEVTKTSISTKIIYL
jgi:hypothetical protein